MPRNILYPLILPPLLCACAGTPPAPSEPGPQAALTLPSRDQTVGFFNRIYRQARAAERRGYEFLYGVRDGVDSFVYEVQKEE